MNKSKLLFGVLAVFILILVGCSNSRVGYRIDKKYYQDPPVFNEKDVREINLEDSDATAEENLEKMNQMIKDCFDKQTILTPDNYPQEMPDWLKSLNISDPQGLKLLEACSHQNSIDDEVKSYNSVQLVYFGNKDTVMREAQKIINNINIELREDKTAQYQYGDDNQEYDLFYSNADFVLDNAEVEEFDSYSKLKYSTIEFTIIVQGNKLGIMAQDLKQISEYMMKVYDM